jgi:hypothetical protein
VLVADLLVEGELLVACAMAVNRAKSAMAAPVLALRQEALGTPAEDILLQLGGELILKLPLSELEAVLDKAGV